MNVARTKIGRIRVKAPSRSMLNVVEMTWPADEGVVSLIDHIARLAGDGHVDAIAVAATYRNGDVVSAFHVGNKLFTLMGGVAYLDQRLRQKAVA